MLSPDQSLVAQWGYFFPPALAVHDIAAQSGYQLLQPQRDRQHKWTLRAAAWQRDSRHVSMLCQGKPGCGPFCFTSYDVHTKAFDSQRAVTHLHQLSYLVSPDARSLLYASVEGGERSVRVVSLDMPASVQLPESVWEEPEEGGTAQIAFIWSPNSARIALLTKRLRIHDARSGEMLLDLDADQQMLLHGFSAGGHAHTHPWCWRGNDALLFVHAAGQAGSGAQIAEVQLSDGGLEDVITRVHAMFLDTAHAAVQYAKLQLSPDGKRLAVSIRLSKSSDAKSDQTLVADLESGIWQTYSHEGCDAFDCVWSSCSLYLTCTHSGRIEGHAAGRVIMYDVSKPINDTHSIIHLEGTIKQLVWAADCSSVLLLAEASHLRSISATLSQVVKETWSVYAVSFVHKEAGHQTAQPVRKVSFAGRRSGCPIIIG